MGDSKSLKFTNLLPQPARRFIKFHPFLIHLHFYQLVEINDYCSKEGVDIKLQMSQYLLRFQKIKQTEMFESALSKENENIIKIWEFENHHQQGYPAFEINPIFQILTLLIVMNTLQQNTISIDTFHQYYFNVNDQILTSWSAMDSFNNLIPLKTTETFDQKVPAYFLSEKMFNNVMVKIRRRKAESNFFTFWRVYIKVQQKKSIRVIQRIIKIPSWVQNLSNLDLQDHLKLDIQHKNKSFDLITFNRFYDRDRLRFELAAANILSITKEKIPAETQIIELQVDSANSLIKNTDFALYINNDLIQYHQKQTLIIDILIQSNERHFKIPLSLSLEQYLNSTVLELKKSIIQFLNSFYKFICFDIEHEEYELAIEHEKHVLILQEFRIIKDIIKPDLNVLRFSLPKYLRKSQIQISPKIEKVKEKAISETVQRTAYLLDQNKILIKDETSLKQIKVNQLRQDNILMSNDLDYHKDRERSLKVGRIYKNIQIYGSLIKFEYLKPSQASALFIYENNVIIYAKQYPPNIYLYSTAHQLFKRYQEGESAYIFDSNNNCLKIVKAQKLQPGFHQFYSLVEKPVNRRAMIIVDDIRILNVAVLSKLTIVVCLQEIGKRERIKKYETLYYTYQQQQNYEKNNKIRKANKYMLKLMQKTYQNYSIYLNHKLPHLNFQERKGKILKNYYKDYCQFIIQRKDVEIISDQLREQSIIFIKQSVKVTKVEKVKQTKPSEHCFKFKVKFNNYDHKQNILIQNLNNLSFQLKENSYFFVTQKIDSQYFQIIQLEKPNFQSNINVLWVDDIPKNNASLMQDINIQSSSRYLSIQINQVTTTEAAVGWIKLFYPYFKWINPTCRLKLITDMYRDDCNEAGADVIDEIVKLGVDIDFSMYVGNLQSAAKILYSRQTLKQIKCLLTVDRVDIKNWCLETALDKPKQARLTQLILQ